MFWSYFVLLSGSQEVSRAVCFFVFVSCVCFGLFDCCCCCCLFDCFFLSLLQCGGEREGEGECLSAATGATAALWWGSVSGEGSLLVGCLMNVWENAVILVLFHS